MNERLRNFGALALATSLAVAACGQEHSSPTNSNIEQARTIQQTELANGTFMFPLPEELTKGSFVVEDNFSPQINAQFLSIGGEPAGTIIDFPAIVEGTIGIQTTDTADFILIYENQFIFEIKTLPTINLKVKPGDTVKLGDQMFIIKYDPNSQAQKYFSENTTPGTEDTFVAMSLENSAQKQFLDLTEQNIIYQNGKPLTIPTFGSSNP